MNKLLVVLKSGITTGLLALAYFGYGTYLLFSTIFVKNISFNILPKDFSLMLYTMPWSLLIDPGPLKSLPSIDSLKYFFYFIFLILNSVILYFISVGLTKWLGSTWQMLISIIIIAAVVIFFQYF